MTNKTLKKNFYSFKENGSLLPSLHTFDLPSLIEKMRHSPTWVKGELNAMIMLKTPEKQIILATLNEGTEIRSFQSNESVEFMIIDGKIEFRYNKESVVYKKGQLFILHENIEYSLFTLEESVVLITINCKA